MKKVRFETPVKCLRFPMEDSECHSPRPFIEKQEATRPNLCYGYPKLLPYNPDPVLRYECSNSSPYPYVPKTNVDNVLEIGSRWPSNDLELSMLDSSQYEPRKPLVTTQHKFRNITSETISSNSHNHSVPTNLPPRVLSSIENSQLVRPVNIHTESNNFFIKRDNLQNIHPGHINSLQSQLSRITLQKENDPLAKKAQLMRMTNTEPIVNIEQQVIPQPAVPTPAIPDECRCHHCVNIIQKPQCSLSKQLTMPQPSPVIDNLPTITHPCACMQPKNIPTCPCGCPNIIQRSTTACSCQKIEKSIDQPQNAVDKKTWMIEKYEQGKKSDGMEVEKQTGIAKEKREPTVSDLFKIIKLQNEQLQLLQEKVDKFISAGASHAAKAPIQNYVTEHVALGTLDSDQHKISIGVMTSFEMVRTSTVINKEIVTQNENAQIQCNRSQISIKEVVSKSQPVTLNFLDGIMPTGRSVAILRNEETPRSNFCDTFPQTEKMNDDKTLNDFSLFNVQVDNATTPQLSPEQSLYLDVRDYSGSESGSDNQSNVGWTYYNKVMTHVNGVLQDSEMPSSASALFRNTKQQCVQMQIDKTNVSVTKRVKFGDDPLGVHQPHLYTAATDTSLKMNQLAAKYLKGHAMSPPPPSVPLLQKQSAMPLEMSFATRNYMERHRILQGTTAPSRSPPAGEIPRFLDITALKQQPKFL